MRLVDKIFIFILLLFSIQSLANEGEGKGEVNAVESISNFINDSHEWHFITIGKTDIAIPLPVILYSEHTGLHIFSSHNLYKRQEKFPFYISKEGLSREKIIEILPDGSQYVPFDVSITKTVIGSAIVALILLIFFISGSGRTIRTPMEVPKGIQNVIEPLVLFVRDDIAKPFAGAKYNRYMPFLLTVFHFILLANLIGLILPLELNITGNISVTCVLAVFTFIITTVSGNKHYWLHIINPDVPIFMKLPVPLIPFIEFLGIFIKPFVLMIRLFANMLSGHMIIGVLVTLIFLMSFLFNPIVGAGTSLISVAFSVFMLIVDLLVAFIQAYIFTLLSAMYFGMATDEGHVEKKKI
ncbi:MAG: F0F1 ATP synthase subunit A [Prolixibacteraceae bacterium]|nr:F0F1 ATP synthase subunit A [Prolixibacteraceae bacterium]